MAFEILSGEHQAIGIRSDIREFMVVIQLVPVDAMGFNRCAVALFAKKVWVASAFRYRKERTKYQSHVGGVVFRQAKQGPSAMYIHAVFMVPQPGLGVRQAVITTKNGHVIGKVLVCVENKSHGHQKAPVFAGASLHYEISLL